MHTDTPALQAVRQMVRAMGGWEVAARECGKKPDSMRLAWSGDPRYVPSQIDAEAIAEYCITRNLPHRHAYANAIASTCGGFVQLPVRDMASGNIHGAAAGLVKECSDVVSAIAAAMTDGSISDNDRRVIERELRELLEQVQAVDGDLQTEHAKTLRRV
jgi:hypothetical protein